jgi:hypothetical protein
MASPGIIDAGRLEDLAREIELLSNGNSILALDVFFVHEYMKTTVKSFTLAEPVYRDNLLPNFLSKFGTMGKVNNSLKIFRAINSGSGKQKFNGELGFKESVHTDLVTTATIDDLTKFLAINNFGRECFWINLFQTVGAASVNLSVFIVFSKELTQVGGIIIEFVQWKILTELYRLIMREFILLNESQQNEIRTLRKVNEEHRIHRELIDNYGHTIFNSMPNINTIISGLESFMEDNFKDSPQYNAISKARKQLELVDLSLRIIGEKELSEIEGQNILSILRYIEARQISSNSIGIIDIDEYPKDLDKALANDARDVFVILWNLWHNASKCKNYLLEPKDDYIYEFYVKLFINEGNLSISFRNIGEMQSGNVKYLLDNTGNTLNPKKSKRRKGLDIIKERMSIIQWSFHSVLVENGWTEIIVNTSKK